MKDNEFKQIFPFQQPRKLQRTLIEKICEAYEEGYKHIVINAPTGIGKSVIGLSIANWFTGYTTPENCISSAYILTSQKLLQDQYVKDFNLPTIKGRDNYTCLYNTLKTCAESDCILKHWTPAKRKNNCKKCLYYDARDYFYNDSSIGILNYAYFLNMTMTDLQPKRKLLILDECHNAELMLLNFSTVIIDKKQCSYLGMYDAILHFPSESASDEEKFDWLFNTIFPDLLEQKAGLDDTFSNNDTDDMDFKMFKLYKHLTELCCNIENIKAEYNEGKPCAVLQDSDKSISFKPIFGKSLAKKYLFPYAEYTLSMSATVLSKDQYCRVMGMDSNETKFFKLPSLFPVKNRPVYSMNVGSMSWKNKQQTYPKLAKVVYNILKKYKNKRGIIHTVNYETAEYIINYITDQDYKMSKRLIMPRGKNRDDNLAFFHKSTKDDLVLISPSLQEGIDLKDELSRFTVICKMPYASLADEWVKKRMELSPKWYGEQTIMNLVQMSGRSVRTETDHAETYILDSDFNWFFKKNKNKFPIWWKDSVILK